MADNKTAGTDPRTGLAAAADAGKTDAAGATPAKRKRSSGPRTAQPIYVFVTVGEDRKVVVNKVTKNAKDIAKWVAEGGVTDINNQLITVEVPASASAEPTATAGQ